ncbi:hypothetical protein ACJVC5_06010 [Peredibacter sp. HCB2-198]|uniref:hypothetical protein n=1 Tax=Peredibacter sp. HCB2-198 TaxID=3383025 RepID=UPI0038B5BAE4
MKLGLLGYPITHSLSPKLYQEILGSKLSSYELFSFESVDKIPPLSFFSEKLDGLNITSPYKTHFMSEIRIDSELVRQIGAVNTLSFTNMGVWGTNTDVIAVQEILTKYQQDWGKLHLLILGSGVMAKMTELVADDLKISWQEFSRKADGDIAQLDLRPFLKSGVQNIVINACSRHFIFQGELTHQEVFWDYNYSFLPHQNTLPSRVKLYQDGQEMLRLQALAAVKFWSQTNPKLK